MPRRAPIRILFPRIQSSFFVFVLCAVGISAFLQVLVSARSLTTIAKELPNDGLVLDKMIVDVLGRDFFLALAISLPTLGFVGMVFMMKFVGPLARIRRFLDEVAKGEETQGLRLRKGDAFRDWIPLLDAATQEARERNAAPAAHEEAKGPRPLSRVA